MKKIIATVLSTVMILSVLATMAIIPVAASTDTGDWMVYATANSYLTDGEGNPDYTSIPDAPLAGYEYTADGFKVTSEASSKLGTTQRYNIVSKNRVNLKRGVTMTVRIEEFKEGEDWWHSFSIWDSPNIAHGNTSGLYGNGYISLIRGVANKVKVGGDRTNPIYDYTFDQTGWTTGLARVESFISDVTYYDTTGTIAAPGTAADPMKFNIMTSDLTIQQPENAPVVKEDGSYELTMRLEYDDVADNYRLFICNVEVPNASINAYLHHRFPDGMAYISFASNGALTDCTTSLTITEFNGSVPTGTDRGEFQANSEEVADIIPGSTVADDQPILLFDAANADGVYKNTGKLPNSAIDYGTKNDGSFWFKPTQETQPYYIVTPRNSYSYEASEFQYVAVLLRNYCSCALDEDVTECYDTETLSMFYCAGQNINPSDNYVTRGVASETSFEDAAGNTYTLFVFEMTADGNAEVADGGWVGRINKVEIIFDKVERTDITRNTFDMVYTAFFKSADAAVNYAENYALTYESCAHDNIQILPEREADCHNMGLTEGQICLDCGEILEQQINLPALQHEWEEVEEIPATCEADGRRAGQICALCGDGTGTPIEKLGHLYAYLEADDGHYAICLRDDCDYEGEVEAHNLVDEICTVCGYGCEHTNTTVTVTKAATCTTKGAQNTTCNDCGFVVPNEIPALGHTNKDDASTIYVEAKAPTCTEDGQTEGYKCGRTGCGEWIQKADFVAKLGHDIEVIDAIEATCTSVGYTEGKVCKRDNCPVEDKILVAVTETAMAQHTYDDDKDADCNVCGAKRTIATEAPTSAPADDNKNEGNNNNDSGSSETPKKKGCKSAVGFGAFAIIASVAAAGVVSFKKKED